MLEPVARKRITPQSAKAKGRNLQKWVRDLIYRLLPELEPGDVESTSMGAGGEDIKLSPAARRRLPVSIECKSLSKIAVYKFYDQAVANCPKGIAPIVIVRQDRRKALLIADADSALGKFIND